MQKNLDKIQKLECIKPKNKNNTKCKNRIQKIDLQNFKMHNFRTRMQKQDAESITAECKKCRVVEMKIGVQKTQMQNVENRSRKIETIITETREKKKNYRTKI